MGWSVEGKIVFFEIIAGIAIVNSKEVKGGEQREKQQTVGSSAVVRSDAAELGTYVSAGDRSVCSGYADSGSWE